MFKKPFKVKSNTAIRSSERRKLREWISRSFPELTADMLSEIIPNKEEISVVKLTTHTNSNITCYCSQKNPIFFEADQMLFPTVYTLWKYPHLTVSFETFPNVFNNISGGADLMFPGVIPPSDGFQEFEKNTVSAISLVGNRAAVAVGRTTCSRSELIQNGAQGKKVNIYHFYKDQLWMIGDKQHVPLITYNETMMSPVSGSHGDDVGGGDDDDDDGEIDQEDHKETTELQSTEDLQNTSNNSPELHGEHPVEGVNDSTETQEPLERISPQEEMDNLLRNCFYQAVINAKKAELPLLVSTFSSQYLHPTCPEGKRIDVKKSSFKKMSKFLNEMQVRGLLEVKETSKGVESITKLTQEHDDLRDFKATDFAKEAKELKELRLEEEKELSAKTNQSVEIREMFAVSGKTIPFFAEFEMRKGSALSSTEVRKCLSDYVKEHELADTSNKKKVHLDALLTDTLFKKGLHEHVLTWDVLMNKMLDNMNPCCEITLPGQSPVVRKGKMEPIEVTTEKRMGNKKVTIIKNLEGFGIDTKQFAQNLQQAAASSTAVNPVPGGKNDRTMVLVQGVQTKHVKKLLEAENIPKKYVVGLDVSSDKKKR